MTRSHYRVQESEVEFTAVRSQGAGGQNVNKVSSAVHLRFDVGASMLPEPIRDRLLALHDRRVTAAGVVVIKAQSSRSRAQNQVDALARLQELIDRVSEDPVLRRPTRPTRSARRRRLQDKARRGALKQLRARIAE